MIADGTNYDSWEIMILRSILSEESCELRSVSVGRKTLLMYRQHAAEKTLSTTTRQCYKSLQYPAPSSRCKKDCHSSLTMKVHSSQTGDLQK